MARADDDKSVGQSRHIYLGGTCFVDTDSTVDRYK